METPTLAYTLTGGMIGSRSLPLVVPPTITSQDQKSSQNCTDRQALADLISRFFAEGISWSADEPAKISIGTYHSALMFIGHLPANVRLPKISPDGDNGLIATWKSESKLILLTVDDYDLHFTTNLGTPEAKTKVFRFDGEAIPKEILAAIAISAY